MVALRVTGCATSAGFADDVKEIVLAPWFTNTDISLPVGSVAARSSATVFESDADRSPAAANGKVRTLGAENDPSP